MQIYRSKLFNPGLVKRKKLYRFKKVKKFFFKFLVKKQPVNLYTPITLINTIVISKNSDANRLYLNGQPLTMLFKVFTPTPSFWNGKQINQIWKFLFLAKPGTQVREINNRFAKSFNSYSKIIQRTQRIIWIQLPSGTKRFFSKKSLTRDWGSWRQKRYLSKTRGVVKNPVDHPNGGSSRNRCPQLTPWGSIAKYNR